MKRCEASEHFRISRNTINLWLQRKAATGDFQANVRTQTGHSHKITDWEAFRAFAAQYRDKTQAEMAQLWPDDISERTISRALQKIDFTCQKRPTATKNVMSTSARPLPIN